MTPTLVRDASASGARNLGDLPEWDLSDLYAAPDAPEVKRDLDWLEKACADFAADYEGKLSDLDAAGLLDCVLRYEKIDTQAEVPEGFAADPANDQSLVTLGAQVLPIPNIAVKLDYTLVSNEAQTGTDRLSASLSYMF